MAMGYFTKTIGLISFSTIFFWITILLSNCQSQTNIKTSTIEQIVSSNNTFIIDSVMVSLENFDIERFKKNVEDLNCDWEYKIDDTIRVRDGYIDVFDGIDETWPIYEYMECYERTIFYPNNFKEKYFYYNNGSIKEYRKYFSLDLKTGIWYKFNKPGSVIERIDMDEGYAFTLDDVIKFGLSKDQDFQTWGSVERGYDSGYNKNVWSTSYIVENEETGERFQDRYVLDGQTGEVLSYIRRPAPIRL